MTAPASIADLLARVRRYPEARYPVQHATAQLHLGVALAAIGRLAEAERSLASATRLFDPQRMPGPAAAAANAWGAALRMAGRHAEAAVAFTRAARGFATADQPADRGAALFNLALVQRECGDAEAALTAFGEARPLLPQGPSTAATLAREIGVTLMTLGRLEAAHTELTDAVALSEQAGEPVTMGAAANALGLTELALGRPDAATRAFRVAAGAHPRTVRPDGFATAQANLGLALEQQGSVARALFAARQALATPGAPEPVRRQAQELIGRLGDDPGGVFAVLDDEAAAGRPAILRAELAVWTTAADKDRQRLAEAWVHGVHERPDAVECVEIWLGAVLELPPASTSLVLDALMRAAAAGDDALRDRLRHLVARALPRYPLPQWTRLGHLLDRAALGAGLPAGWG